jgi:GAF domain-containing protein
MSKNEKKAAYELALQQIRATIAGEDHWILKMATINCLLRDTLPYYFWTGFYLVDKGELIVGPYQGTLGCLHIPFGKGVCGTAAKEKKTQLVPDVHLFPGHIACDSQSASEIVVPVLTNTNELIAVFDVDSTEKNSFDEIDKDYLEAILSEHFSQGNLRK